MKVETMLRGLRNKEVSNQTKAFFDPDKRNKRPTFATSEKKVKLKNAANEEVRIEKDVLSTLLAEATKTGNVIDIDKVLTFSMSPHCPPLCTPDGNIRKK